VVISAASLTSRMSVAEVRDERRGRGSTNALDGCAFGCHIGQRCRLTVCMHVRSKNRNAGLSQRRQMVESIHVAASLSAPMTTRAEGESGACEA